MLKERSLKFISSILIKSGNKLLQDSEEQIKELDENDFFTSNKSHSFGETNNMTSFDKNQILQELRMLKAIYSRAKNNLEKKLYNPKSLTIAESIILNQSKSTVTFSGHYKDFIFTSYCNGDAFFCGPKDLIIPDGKGNFISRDPNINPIRVISWSLVHGYAKIQCSFPLDCLRDLAMQTDLFAAMSPNERDKYLKQLYEEIEAEEAQKTNL